MVTLDWTLRRLSVAMILGYQRHLSPLKGYRCAHRVFHGGESCSEYGRQAFTRVSFVAAWKLLRNRFRECKLASRALREGRRHTLEANAALHLMAAARTSGSGQERSSADSLATSGMECCCQCGAEFLADAACHSIF